MREEIVIVDTREDRERGLSMSTISLRICLNLG